MNCRVGKKINDEVVGKYGKVITNDNGKPLIQICKAHKLMVPNTYFNYKDIYKLGKNPLK